MRYVSPMLVWLLMVVPASAQQVKFGKSATGVGEVTEQSVQLSLDVSAVTREGGTVLDQSQIRLERRQRRRLEAMQLNASGMVIAARVSFLESRSGADGEKPEKQIIEGRSYDCTRVGDELRIVCKDGTMPTPEEHSLVSDSVDSLGRVNPLATYLAGRTLIVGEKVALPPAVGAGLMSRDAVGEVTRFEVTLTEIEQVEGVSVAVLDTVIETHENAGRQLGLVVTGKLALEVETCRTRRLNLSGPIAMAETTGGIGTPQQMHGTGKLSVALEATYSRK